MPKEIEYIYKNPILFALIASGWILSAIIAYMSENIKYREDQNTLVLNAQKEVVELQTRLQIMQEEEIQDISVVLQQFVDAYDYPAWVKYYDYTDQVFYFSVVNNSYVFEYGVFYISFGKTDSQLYSDRKLSPQDQARLLEYAVNDRTAIRAGPGKCIRVDEWAFPVKKEPVKRPFKKCMLAHRNSTFVFGYQVN